MSREDFLRDSMQRAASSGEPPVGDAWNRFQRKRSRGNFVRGVAVSTGALGVFIALFFTLPGLNSRPAAPFTGSGDLGPNTSLKTYVDPIVGFAFEYPSDWILEGAPGKSVVVHPDLEYRRVTTCASCDPKRTEEILAPYVSVGIREGAPEPLCAPQPCGVVGDVGDDPTVTQTTTKETIAGRTMWVFDFVTAPATATPREECVGCHEKRVIFDQNWAGTGSVHLSELSLWFPAGDRSELLSRAQAIFSSFRHAG